MANKKKKKPTYGVMRKKALKSGRSKSGSSHVAMAISRAESGGKFAGKKADVTSVVKAANRTSPKGKVRRAQNKRDTQAYNVTTNKYKEGE